jgi:hypothetical protein
MRMPNMTWVVTDETPTYEKRLQVLEVGTVGCSRQLLERVALAYEGAMVATLMIGGQAIGETLVDLPENTDLDTLLMTAMLEPSMEAAMASESL